MRNATNLTHKQRTFADTYVANGRDATAAARRAGYSETTIAKSGWSLLQHEGIATYIAKLEKPVVDSLVATKTAKLEMLWRIAVDNEKPAPKISVLAINECNKMQGHHARTDVDVTSGGKELSAVVFLPDNERNYVADK